MVVHMGSITDRAAVRKACDGADIVIHLASIIDWSLFPDWGTLHEVNVKGMLSLIRCRYPLLSLFRRMVNIILFME